MGIKPSKWEEELLKHRICPRCKLPFSYLERRRDRSTGKVYYYVVHYEGYTRTSSGKIRKKVRKCYLGPDYYDYGSRTHEEEGLVLRGMLYHDRVFVYLDALIGYLGRVRLDPGSASTLAAKFRMIADRLEEAARRERERQKELGRA